MTSSDAGAAAAQTLKAQGIRFVRFELPDLHGVSRSKLIPIDHVAAYGRTGLNMYGGVLALDSASQVVSGSGLHEEVKYRDQYLFPDWSTLQVVPWVAATAKVICDTRWGSGSPIEAAPRYVLARVLDEAKAMGYDVCYAHELEFYLLDPKTREPLFGGVHIFNTVRNQYAPFLDSVITDLQNIGIDVITHNCEYAPSQFEIVYSPTFGIAGGDTAFTFKNAVKELAHRAGYLATFMSKPGTTMSGSGCHVHISLIDRDSGKNAFVDPRAPDVIPDAMRHFTQGILHHASAMMALIGPTPNCYRRLRPHTFAPSNISWGEEDRSAMVRLKHVGGDNAHVEMRAASGLSNPYLSAAATLAAGLLGLKAKQPLQPEVSGPSEDDPTLTKLPTTLDDALESLEANTEMRGLLGDPFVHVFARVKRHELARFHAHVSDWERNEYLEVF